MGLFSSARGDTQIGVDFLPDGIAVAQVQVGRKNSGRILRNEFVSATGQQEQAIALKSWVGDNNLQKFPCVCLVANDDCDIYQVDKPEVDKAEMIQAVTWKIKDLINYDVAHAVVDCYPMPTSSKNNQQLVGAVTAREAVISNYVETIKASGMNLVALDVHQLVMLNLEQVRKNSKQTLAVLSLSRDTGLLSIYNDSDLYVSRDFKTGIDQLNQVSSDDQSVFDSLLLEIQRSLDYFESYYGMGGVNQLQIFPQIAITEKMANYLQNLTSFEIDFLNTGENRDTPDLGQHCFHAYCAALRGVTL